MVGSGKEVGVKSQARFLSEFSPLPERIALSDLILADYEADSCLGHKEDGSWEPLIPLEKWQLWDPGKAAVAAASILPDLKSLGFWNYCAKDLSDNLAKAQLDPNNTIAL